MKFRLASGILRLGLTLGKQADEQAVRDVILKTHPRNPVNGLIRIGGDSDGGYLIPNELDGIVACFSPGVGSVVSFEQEMIARGIPCFLADRSVSEIPISHALIKFEKKFIGVVNGGDVMTMDDWVNRNAPPQGDLLLQMDIEGWEWPAFLSMSEQTLNRFRVIVMEMHNLDQLIDRVGFPVMAGTLEKILNSFNVVHLHPNNSSGLVAKRDIALPRVMEATFLRKDYPVAGYRTEFPHPLDEPNAPGMRDIVLPELWHH